MEWRELLRSASHQLRAVGIEDAYRESAYLWQAASGRSLEEWIIHETPVTEEIQKRFLAFVHRRVQREPVAYITGVKEFYGLSIVVTPDVLIPRPETELMVDAILEGVQNPRVHLVDVGTGSGAIALALKYARPLWDIQGVDVSEAALRVARENCERLQLEVNFLRSHLLLEVPRRQDVIVANLPYIDHQWQEASPELGYEPDLALYAAEGGLSTIRQLIYLAPGWLNPSGRIFLECGAEQGQDVASYLADSGFHHIKVLQDYAGHDRIVIGRRR